MKNNDNDIIDIPTELEVEPINNPIESLDELTPTLEASSNVEMPQLEMLDNLELKTEEKPLTSNETTVGEEPEIIPNEIPQNLMPEKEIVVEEFNAPASAQELLAPEMPSLSDEPLKPQIIPEISMANNNSELEKSVDLKVESIDGNPDILDMEVKEDTPKKKKTNNVFKIIVIILALGIVGGGSFLLYKFVFNKPSETSKSELKVESLKSVSSFEEAYKRVSAEFNTTSEGENTSYTVQNGMIKFITNDKELELKIENTTIALVSYLKEYKNSEIIAIKDDKENYYFAHVKKDLKENIILTKEDNNLIKIENNEKVDNIAIANYLNSEEIFYLAIKNDENYFVTASENAVKLDPVYIKVYNGINIDFNNIAIDNSKKEMIPLNGVGLFYDGALYLYEGTINSIKEIQVLDNDEPIICKEIVLAYKENLEFLDLYVITTDDYLYKINLLNVDIKEEKVEFHKYENKVIEYTHLNTDIASSLDINLENGESIKLK